MGRGDSEQALDFADLVRVGLSEQLPPAAVSDLAENEIRSRMQEANLGAGRHALAQALGVKQAPLAAFLDGREVSTSISEALGERFQLDPPILTCMTALAALKWEHVRPKQTSGNSVLIKLAIRELQARGLPWDQQTGWLEAYMEGNASEADRDTALRTLWEIELGRVEREYPILPVRYVSAAEGARGIIRAKAAAMGIMSAKELAVKTDIRLASIKNLYSGDLLTPELPNAKAIRVVAETLQLGVAARFWACIASETLPFAAREGGKRLLSPIARREWDRQLALLKAIDGEPLAQTIQPMVKQHPVKGTRSDWEAPFHELLANARKSLQASAS